jgi:hypothetical protein
MTGTINPTLPVAGEPNSTADPKILGSLKTLRDEINALLNSENEIPTSALAESKVTWYTPTVIATEENRTNTAFGTLVTPDEITGVVMPTSGLIIVGYSALVKSSVASAGNYAIFLNSNQLRTPYGVQENQTVETSFIYVSSFYGGLTGNSTTSPSIVTTGQVVGAPNVAGGLCTVFAASGTYNVSIRFKATSGSVVAKERKLWVYTLGG